MSEEDFWAIIALLRFNSADGLSEGMQRAEDMLCTLSEAHIKGFQEVLAEKLYAIDTRQHCRYCYRGELDPDNGNHYISADDFLYSRCAVVARGRLFYDVVVKYPSRMPSGVELEDLLYLAPHAYERKTGKDFDHLTALSYESFSNLEGWRATANTRQGTFTSGRLPPGNRRPT
jgi:hypothetical protein